MKNKILLFIFASLFGVSAVIEPISSAADFVTGATYIVHNNGADQIAGASTSRGSREDDDDEYEDHEDEEDEEDEDKDSTKVYYYHHDDEDDEDEEDDN